MVKRVKRILFWSAIGFAALLLVAALVVHFNLNHIIRRSIEERTTASLNLETKVDSVSLALWGGKLKLRGFKIASPPGFAAEPMLVTNGSVVVEHYMDLRKDPVRLTSVTLTKPRLLIEQVDGKLNVRRMVELIPATPPGVRPLRLVIGELSVEEPTVVLRNINLPGLAKELTVNVRSFKLTNIGSGDGDKNGALVRDVVSQLVVAVVAHASDSESLPPDLRRLLKGDVSVIISRFGGEAQSGSSRRSPAIWEKPSARSSIL